MIQVTDKKTPNVEDNSILIQEKFGAIPTPPNQLSSGVYYSWKGKWTDMWDKFITRAQALIDLNLSDYVPKTRTITINGDTKDLSADGSWTVSGGLVQSVSDTNTVDLTVDGLGDLTANVRHQDTATINLTDDAFGLKADLATGAVVANLGYTPEDVANKTTTILGNESSTTLYPNVKGVVDWSQSVFQQKNIIAVSTVISTHTGDTAETKVASVMIPGGTYAAGNVIRIIARNIKTGTAAGWTPRIRIGTADDLSGTVIFALTPTASVVNDACVKTGVIRDISTDTQFGAITVRNDDAVSNTGAGFVSYSFNWANDVWIVFSVQNGSALDTSGNYYHEITKS